MFDTTPQERLALFVIAILIAGGAIGRYAVGQADAREALQFTLDAADTLNAGSTLRKRVEAEVSANRIRETPLAEGERLDPNTAPAEQLDRLPGIGPAIAERIVERRREVGRFRSLEDLRTVPGVGPAALDRIAPYVTLGRGPVGASPSTGAQIDLNRAEAAELDELPGIGPSIAERIVTYREEHGRFREWQDLENVSGIGPRLRERLQSVARLGS